LPGAKQEITRGDGLRIEAAWTWGIGGFDDAALFGHGAMMVREAR
jgi:hypothetical protein